MPAPHHDHPHGPLRIVLLYGGRSAEHEVSCISARFVLASLDPELYEVTVLGVTHDGRWLDTTALARDASSAPADATDGAAAGTGFPSPDTLGPDSAPEVDPWPILRAEPERTVVFPMIHGTMGEDGTLQGMLEVAGVAYVGSGVLGSAAAMDKGIAKALFAAAGLPQVRWLSARREEVGNGFAERVERELAWPVFVKPANLGSTIGISRAAGPRELGDAVAEALRFDEFVVVEEEVHAREIELAVLGHVDLAVSQPGETLPSREYYDFEDKYLLGSASQEVRIDLAPEVAEAARELAVQACRALRVEGMARVDFFYEADGRGLLINEINTVPGFTAISMYPMLWEAEGMSAAKLVDDLIAAARSRHERRRAFQTTRLA